MRRQRCYLALIPRTKLPGEQAAQAARCAEAPATRHKGSQPIRVQLLRFRLSFWEAIPLNMRTRLPVGIPVEWVRELGRSSWPSAHSGDALVAIPTIVVVITNLFHWCDDTNSININ